MKFRNTIGNGYAFRMNPAVPRTVLARLRASTRLAVLVLLIFALKIGAAAACANDDFADLGFGVDSQHGATLKASATDEPGALKKGSVAAGACSHCGCHHHAAAMAPDTPIAFVIVPQVLTEPFSGVPPSAAYRLELRPPIG